MPASRPTITAASVAAACATESENTSAMPGHERSRERPAMAAARNLPTTTTSSEAPPSARVSAFANVAGSMSMPVEIRNIGTSSDEPKNSSRSMSGPRLGMSRFTASPAKNAPTMPSSPPRSASTATPVKVATTAMKRRPRSWPAAPEKNLPTSRGTPRNVTATRIPRAISSSATMAASEPSPVWDPTTTASTNRASVSVITVPDTAIDTPGWPARPLPRAMG